MNTNLLQLADPIFSAIKGHFADGNHQLGMNIIMTTPPPSEWIIELPSKSKQGETFKTLPIDIMEAAMKIIFKSAGIKTIHQPIVSQDKQGRFATTVIVDYYYEDQFGRHINLPGIATVASPDIHLLELATPKASSMAVKNAIKQLGDFFGKSLNKTEEDTEIPTEQPEKKITQEELLSSLTEQVLTAKTIDELKSYRLIVYNKSTPLNIQDIYEQRLRNFKK